MTDAFLATNLRAALRNVLEADEDVEAIGDESQSREAVAAAVKRMRQKLNAARWGLEQILDRLGNK
jgi:hypothetical protein